MANLLDDLRFFLCDYIVFPKEEQATATALWIAHTWVIEAFDFTPYLSIGSPVKRCGKSTLLDCLSLLCRTPWQAVSPSPAVLYRKVESDCPTLLLDEVDTIFAASKAGDGKEDLRALLNAGFQRGAKVPRCVGPSHTLTEFSVFLPESTGRHRQAPGYRSRPLHSRCFGAVRTRTESQAVAPPGSGPASRHVARRFASVGANAGRNGRSDCCTPGCPRRIGGPGGGRSANPC